jgi:hypothetical protein
VGLKTPVTRTETNRVARSTRVHKEQEFTPRTITRKMSTNGGTATTNVTIGAWQGQKENNKNIANAKEYYGGSKKFTGVNDSLKEKKYLM